MICLNRISYLNDFYLKIGKLHIWEPRPLEEQILEIFFMGIEEMKAVDIRTVDPESLVDVTGILISDDMTKEEILS